MLRLNRLNIVLIVVFCVLYFSSDTLNAQVSAGPCPVSTITKKVNYSDKLYWSVFTDEIQPGECVSLNVEGQHPPFQWSLEDGVDFFLEPGEEDSYRLCAGGSACGPATIKVKDVRGHKIYGYVRSSAGQWVQVEDACPIPGPANNGDFERIEGKYKVFQRYTGNGAVSSSNCHDDEDGTFTCDNAYDLGSCYTRCESCDGGSGMGCVECISNGGFPCVQQEPCGDGTYKTVRCYCTWIFTLYEWQCQ